MKLIEFPLIDQFLDYNCGPKLLQAVFTYYGHNYEFGDVLKMVGTTLDGTPVPDMERAIDRVGLQRISKSMSLDEALSYIDKDIPLITLVQRGPVNWLEEKDGVLRMSDKIDWKNIKSRGHYAGMIGYDNERVIFADPMSAFFRTSLTKEELMPRWHDEADGVSYNQYCIAVFGPKPAYRHDRIIPMP